MDLYKYEHLGFFNAYGLLDGELVYKSNPKIIKSWKYIEGTPIRQILYVDKKVAEQLDFM
ncbi:hypothetical protein [Clostridium gasigenes]|uniref:hypothetical protein n=1 Tax=Clostridium gasigenes TaxID=94869 RepID=UPI001C0C2F65|nr:hypothetical protein [Clostridium gasigenes]MBU3108402.1 hypothetical protein [Clostridium gasigenes]